MQAPKTKTAAFSVDADTLFATLNRVIESGKYELTDTVPERRRVGFKSGKTALSWGQEYLAEAVDAENGSSQLNVVCGGIDGAPKALLDGWKNGKAADKFISAVQAATAN